MIGTTRDPATPYTWAVKPARQLPGALLTYDGDGPDGLSANTRMPPASVRARVCRSRICPTVDTRA